MNTVEENGRRLVTIKAGSKVQIKVVMVAESVRSHVALVVYYNIIHNII